MRAPNVNTNPGSVAAEQLSARVSEEESTTLDDYVAALTHSWLKTLTTLGFTLIPIFFLLDVFMMPRELLPRFGVYRGVATAIVVAQFFVVRHTSPSPRSVVHGYVFTLVAGGMIALMTTDLGGFGSTYYAGLNLVLIAVNLLLPWEAIHSAVNSALIILLYVVLNLLLPNEAVASGMVVNNLYFLSSTAIIAVSINYVKQKLVKQEFFLRADLKAARDALWGEMEVAKHIQTALLPRVHQLPGYSVAATMLPADEVGGDYYDIMTTRHGETWLAIGDVSGHGVESGLIMMMTQTSLDTAINQEAKLPPSRALGRVNDVIRRNISRLGVDRYMTITALRIDDATITFAGKHQDLLVYRAARGMTEVVPTQGAWLGVVDDLDAFLEDQTLTLHKDDVLLLYTDGITEAMNGAGEMFGEDRLRQALTRYAAQPVEQLVESIVREVREHAVAREDDLTLIVLRRSP